MPRAFVTGGTGFVGLNLVLELLDRGFEVVVFHRPTSDLARLGRLPVERVTGDLADPASVRRAMPARPDAVFHVAASTNVWSRRNAAQTRANVDGTHHVAAAALEQRARRFVHTSSIAAYGLHREPVTEETPQTGATSWINYVRTKALAEVEVRGAVARGLDAVILNPSNVVGPYDGGGWATMIALACAGRLPCVPPGRGSFCHVREVARAHAAALEKGRTGENYLLGGTEESYREMARLIGEVAGRDVPARAVPAPLLRGMARLSAWRAALAGRQPLLTPEGAALAAHGMVCRTGKAERELGYRPLPLRTMIEDCYRWMVAEGRLNGR